MSLNQFKNICPNLYLEKTDIQLVSYCQNSLKILGVASVNVNYNDTEKELKLYVVEGNKNPLVGLEWIINFKFKFQIGN